MIKTNLPSIAKIKRENENLAISVLAEIITDYVQFVNIGKNMNVKQIAQTSTLIFQYFPHLNLADLKLFFDKMKLGHYGNNYDAVDGQKILLFLDSYNSERMEEVATVKTAQHNDQKKQERLNTDFHPSVVEAMKKAIGEKDYSKNFEPKEERPKTESELLIQRWSRQFDNLYSKYGVVRGVRYLKIGSTLLTYEKFIEKKFENKM